MNEAGDKMVTNREGASSSHTGKGSKKKKGPFCKVKFGSTCAKSVFAVTMRLVMWIFSGGLWFPCANA